ncbi:MAG: glutamate-5-semialdehyde dehydrogenase [Rhodospirillaceae bacterium]|jgi:glutamate-5-semialdehyde dehydrogenase|nr:glutamate-5-semialdehyde dehydrogenase [Rhodospirillaceae bacterium]
MNKNIASTIEDMMINLGLAAKQAAPILAKASSEQKNIALKNIAAILRLSSAKIIEANELDITVGIKNGLTAATIDRLSLNDKRIETMACGVEEIATLPDPIGREMARWHRPNGLDITRICVPIGVIGIIYESRPNVTVDAGVLCLKSGNVAILRGGSESFFSSSAIFACLQEGLISAGLPIDCIQMVPITDRDAVNIMLTINKLIDVIVLRGSRSLIELAITKSKIPLFQHLEGICHIYVDSAADLDMARRVVLNSKMRRTGICGAAETLLVDRKAKANYLQMLIKDLLEAGCAVRGDTTTQSVDQRVTPANEEDWTTEYLDAIISVKLVDGVRGAIDHIERHGSHHTESIITNDYSVATTFLNEVDSAIVLHNASTQFADGGEFGMGAEIGISTGKLHARGPIGVEQLTSFKYVVNGSGQIRS